MPPSYQTVQLQPGAHFGPEDGVCVMELASMLAGEPFSDHPRSVSKPLAALLRGYNDALDDTRRQTLKPYASACVGTGGGRAADRRRRTLVRRWLSEEQGGGSALAVANAWWSSVDLLGVGVDLGRSVRSHQDAGLHGRVLALVEALIAVDATTPVVLGLPERGERTAVRA
jgi:hypothetical protein